MLHTLDITFLCPQQDRYNSYNSYNYRSMNVVYIDRCKRRTVCYLLHVEANNKQTAADFEMAEIKLDYCTTY